MLLYLMCVFLFILCICLHIPYGIPWQLQDHFWQRSNARLCSLLPLCSSVSYILLCLLLQFTVCAVYALSFIRENNVIHKYVNHTTECFALSHFARRYVSFLFLCTSYFIRTCFCFNFIFLQGVSD